MTRRLLLALITAGALMAPESTAAQQDAHHPEALTGQEMQEHEPPPAEHALGPVEAVTSPQFLLQLLNFTVLVGLLVWAFRPKLQQFLRSRRLSVEQGLKEAEEIRANAETKHKEYSQRLDKLDQHLEELRSEMARVGEAERERIIESAHKQAERLRAETEFLVEQQAKQLRNDLREHAVHAAVATAEALLREKLSGQDQQRIADQYLAHVQETAKAHREKTTASDHSGVHEQPAVQHRGGQPNFIAKEG